MFGFINLTPVRAYSNEGHEITAWINPMHIAAVVPLEGNHAQFIMVDGTCLAIVSPASNAPLLMKSHNEKMAKIIAEELPDHIILAALRDVRGNIDPEEKK